MSTNTTPINQTEPQEELPENLTCEQLWSMETTGEKPTILDVREQDEWESGHIEYATHLPLSKVETDAEHILPNKSEMIITCCARGARGQQAADKLRKMGYSNVKNLSGGYSGYCSKEDKPEVEGPENEA